MSGIGFDCVADTSVVIGLSRGDPRVQAVMSGKRFAIAFVTEAELLLGVRRASNPETALRRIDAVLREITVLHTSEVTPSYYAGVCHDLEQVGRRIPSNDMWIAAVAMEHGLPLTARDEHFSRANGLHFIPC